jgi:hypothetical protein
MGLCQLWMLQVMNGIYGHYLWDWVKRTYYWVSSIESG